MEIQNTIIKDDKPSLLDTLPEEDKKKYYAVKINNRLHELTYQYQVKENDQIKFLDLTDSDAVKIYERSLRLVIAKIIYDINPKWKLKFSYSVSRTVFAHLTTNKGEEIIVTTKLLSSIRNSLKELIEKDIPFERFLVTVKQARDIFKKEYLDDHLFSISKRKEETCHIYKLENYYNYMYGYMVPSTGYLTKYILRPFDNGFLIQYPRAEEKGEIPPFEDSPTYGKTLSENALWGKTVGTDTLPKINKYLKEHGDCDFINMCESHHNNMLADLGQKIKNHSNSLKLICIAGPSSSGKTTFANRLRLELMSRGLNPIRISIDDYYKPREECPLDEDGNVDLETIEALKTEQFNEDLLNLIEGETVCLPIFDFKSKKHLTADPIKLEPNQIIIIEGIHALNDRLTPSIPRHQKFKIYIAPQAQINIDDHNPMSLTDLRLLRRIVRDYRTRNATAEDTIRMWPSVRKGEFKWIYSNQEGADFVFNSLLPYELNIMKKYALPILNEVPTTSDTYTTANKLKKFLKYFDNINDKLVPNNSLMREFIGGSCFYDA